MLRSGLFVLVFGVGVAVGLIMRPREEKPQRPPQPCEPTSIAIICDPQCSAPAEATVGLDGSGVGIRWVYRFRSEQDARACYDAARDAAVREYQQTLTR